MEKLLILSFTLGLIFLASSPVLGQERPHLRIYEAEEAVREGTRIERTRPYYSGSGYVTGFTNTHGSLSFSVWIPTAKTYSLHIGFGTPHGRKGTHLLINGEFMGEIMLPVIEGFGETSAGTYALLEGENVITLEKGWGWYDIDYIRLSLPMDFQGLVDRPSLVNENATGETRSLFSFLLDNYGKKIIAGQQEFSNQEFFESDYIFALTGKRPAIMGLDFMEYSPSRVERGSFAKETEAAIRWHKQGGIVKFTWHWNAPKDLEKNGEPWWRGFYTEATDFDLALALDPSSEDYVLLLRDMDAIAQELKILQEHGVPVLWRPLHEAEGGWFWWGAKGPCPAKELWKLMYHRFTFHHELHNLIWIWNASDPLWYPGDSYVDINSYDSYTGKQMYGPVTHEFSRLEILSQNKLIALAENGAIPDPTLLSEHNAWWSFFVTWNGSILREWNEETHLQYVYHHPLVITLWDLPNLSSYPW